MNVIIHYLDDMLFFVCVALPFVFVWRFSRWRKRGLKLKESFHELGIFLLVLVLIGLFSQTIIPRYGLMQPSLTNVNLDLFRVIKETYNAIKYLGFWQPFYINFLGNIILFMPIGFLLPLLSRRMEDFPYTVVIGLLVSLFIEIMQLPQNRSSDVDDLWLNTLGALLGYLFYLIINRKLPTVTLAFKKIKE
ncbi:MULTISPECIES: VanZ family protein [Bacillaceae]|uniref:VanZ family protein n=1 Tax=Bacillaceae TaxID=186817 RepID=UPI0006F912C2|nr:MULTISPECIES: VanZ family protein [Bacillaceae]KQL32444.1 hypothetical protein AN959_19490 [Psychrobacillus sp. FJAT-21963]MDF2068415.1 VanZ family protein [Bacillus sp. Cr_A10]